MLLQCAKIGGGHPNIAYAGWRLILINSNGIFRLADVGVAFDFKKIPVKSLITGVVIGPGLRILFLAFKLKT